MRKEPIYVDGDPVRLEQVFANLLLNASKFSPDGAGVFFASPAHAPDGERPPTASA